MALHPEVLWAQRSSESEAEKVGSSSLLLQLTLFLISGFPADAVECRVSDGQLA